MAKPIHIIFTTTEGSLSAKNSNAIEAGGVKLSWEATSTPQKIAVYASAEYILPQTDYSKINDINAVSARLLFRTDVPFAEMAGAIATTLEKLGDRDRSADAGDRRRGKAELARPHSVPATPLRTRRKADQRLQVPHDEGRRPGGAGDDLGRVRGRHQQGQGRPARDRDREAPAPLVDRRAAPADQRAPRGDVAGRPASPRCRG